MDLKLEIRKQFRNMIRNFLLVCHRLFIIPEQAAASEASTEVSNTYTVEVDCSYVNRFVTKS